MTRPAEFVGGRLLLTPHGAAMLASALRLAARAALRDGIDYRARDAADDFTWLLEAAEACAATAGGHQARTWRLVVPASAEALTTAQAAEIIGAPPRAVVRAIARGELAARKVGRQWLITEDDARRLARDRRRNHARPGPPRRAEDQVQRRAS